MLIRPCIDYWFSGPVAREFGIPAALVFNRICWAINYHAEDEDRWKEKYFKNDTWWMHDSFQALARHFDGIVSIQTIKRAVAEMEAGGLLVGRHLADSTWDRTKWYTVDAAVYKRIQEGQAPAVLSKDQNEKMHSLNMRPCSSSQNETMEGLKMGLSSSPNSLPNSLPKNQKKPKPSVLSAPPKPCSKFDQQDRDLAVRWLGMSRAVMKWQVAPNAWTEEKFAAAIAKARSAAKLSHLEMSKMLDFIERDAFWKDNALSPAGLLKANAQGIRKIDNILVQATKNTRKFDKLKAMMDADCDPF